MMASDSITYMGSKYKFITFSKEERVTKKQSSQEAQLLREEFDKFEHEFAQMFKK